MPDTFIANYDGSRYPKPHNLLSVMAAGMPSLMAVRTAAQTATTKKQPIIKLFVYNIFSYRQMEKVQIICIYDCVIG